MKTHLSLLCILVIMLCLTVGIEAGTGLDDFVGANSVIEEVVQQLQLRHLDGDPVKVEKIVISAIVKSADPQGRILSDEEMVRFTQAMKGVSLNAGILIESTDGYPVVSTILNTNAYSIPVGSRILSIDGNPVGDKDIFTIYHELHTADGANVVTSSGDGIITSSVVLAACSMPSLMGTELLPRGISYIKLRGLYDDADPVLGAVGSALLRKETLGTIVDLRGAGGVNLDAVVSLAELFRGRSETLFTIESLSDKKVYKYTRKKNEIKKTPVLILVDGETRGAAEVFAAVCGSGIILLGEETAGDLLLRDFVTLSSGRHLYLLAHSMTTACGVKYTGYSGVLPNIQVAADAHTSWSTGKSYEPFYDRKPANGEEENQRLTKRLGDDTILRRGVDILLGLDALNLN